MLGSDLFAHFKERYGAEKVIGTDYDTLDITNATAVEEYIGRLRPSWIVNAAAYTDVDKAETERELALALNATGPKVLANAAKRFDARFVHFSTEYVFNGESTRPWTEEDIPNPAQPNHYAETKLLGERAALAYEGSLLLRVQWLYGEKRDRFTPLRTKAVFTPFIDQLGAPTWTREVAKTVSLLMDKGASGLFHYAYDDSASWFEVYELVKSELGLSTELIPKRSSEVKLPAKRPLYGVMSNRKLCAYLGVAGLGSWKKPFKEFLEMRKDVAIPLVAPEKGAAIPAERT